MGDSSLAKSSDAGWKPQRNTKAHSAIDKPFYWRFFYGVA